MVLDILGRSKLGITLIAALLALLDLVVRGKKVSIFRFS